ncbi:hypothetical protein DEO72_LG10g1653 [Vigna unguiculata]|uniref:Uncharacterized protein n=1 Tax=Vigna unguiculata TaxID=3917 RepID=A0A4D6N9A7_VIGUN|nr:hypothetical protein DEO72_LG10g1653 [Vigna unguiculata]
MKLKSKALRMVFITESFFFLIESKHGENGVRHARASSSSSYEEDDEWGTLEVEEEANTDGGGERRRDADEGGGMGFGGGLGRR